MRYLKRWLKQSLYRQVFTLMMGLVLLLNVSLVIMAWVNFSLYNENVIHQKLNQQMRMLLDDSFKQGRLIKAESEIFSSFIASDKGIPHYLLHIKTLGVHVIESPSVYVQAVQSPFSDGLLYLLYFPEEDVLHKHSQSYVIFCIIGIVFFLLLIGFIATLYLTRLIVTPITLLQENVDKVSLQHPPEIMNRSDELGQLSRAFTRAFERLNAFIAREHRFTRYASHELRTPVTIIQGALDVIEHAPNLEKALPPLQRIHVANKDMLCLINTFLSLSREEKSGMESFTPLAHNLDYCLSQQFGEERGRVRSDTSSSSKLVHKMYAQVVLQNMLRNADCYSRGVINIELKYDRLMVSNDIDIESDAGYGHGLDIINTICKKANWLAYYHKDNKSFYWVIYF